MSNRTLINKYVLHIMFNLYCFAAGIGILWIASYMDRHLYQWSEFVDSKQITVPQVMTAIGFALLVFAVLCTPCGTLKNSSCRFGWISVLLVIVMVGELLLDNVVFNMRSNMEQYALKQMEHRISVYNKTRQETARQSWNVLQSDIECCGIDGPKDWKPVTLGGELPTSCCYALQINQSCTEINSYTVGCFEKFTTNLQQINRIKCWSALGFTLVQIFAVFLVFYCKCGGDFHEEYEHIY